MSVPTPLQTRIHFRILNENHLHLQEQFSSWLKEIMADSIITAGRQGQKARRGVTILRTRTLHV
jgi:hypothetical protein